MVPLRFVPSAPQAISALANVFGAASGVEITARSLRTGMVLARVQHAQLEECGRENYVHIALIGQWTPDGDTYQHDYMHPGFFNAMYSHVVRPTCDV